MAKLNFEKLSQKIGELLREISNLKTNLKEKEGLVLQKENIIREHKETIQQLKRDLLFQQGANEKLREEKILCEEEIGMLKKKMARKKVKTD
ncbi:MAG: hypothetical protein ACNA7V_01930 [Bacteroidales bacterium]